MGGLLRNFLSAQTAEFWAITTSLLIITILYHMYFMVMQPQLVANKKIDKLQIQTLIYI